jgi:hypothetical protein
MIVEMSLNNNIQICFWLNDFTFSKGNKCNCVHYWNVCENKFWLFNLDKMSIRNKISKLKFVQCLNKILIK